MKKSKFLNAMFVAIAMIAATIFTACTDKDPNPNNPDDPKANEWVFDGNKLAIEDVEIKYLGDYAMNGTENFYVMLSAEPVTIEGTEYASNLQFDIFADAAPLNGTFTYDANYAVAGTFSGGARIYYTATTIDEGTEVASIKDGSISVKKLSGSNQYEITFNVIDEEGIQSTAYYTGTVTYIDDTEKASTITVTATSTFDESKKAAVSLR